MLAGLATKKLQTSHYGALHRRDMQRAGCCQPARVLRLGASAPQPSDLVGAPSLRVVLAHFLGVRRGANGRADLELPMGPLNRRLGRAAVRLTPEQGDLSADRDLVVDGRQRQHRALVAAV